MERTFVDVITICNEPKQNKDKNICSWKRCFRNYKEIINRIL